MITDTTPPRDTEHEVYELELVGAPEFCWYLYLHNCALAVTGGPLTPAQARTWADEQLARSGRTGPVEWINSYDDVDEDTAARFAARLTPVPIPAKLTLAGAAAAAAIAGGIALLLAIAPHTGAGAGAAGGVFAVLVGAHYVSDYWVQTQHQADHKGEAGLRGWLALLGHVATYTAVAALAVGALVWRTGVDLQPVNVALALGLGAVTHGWIDRRHTLARLARATGSGRFYAVSTGGVCGSLLLDQAAHLGLLAVAALLAV